jgi:hypothetical protein
MHTVLPRLSFPRYTKITNGITHSYIKDNTQQSQVLQTQSSKQEMVQRALSATSAIILG